VGPEAVALGGEHARLELEARERVHVEALQVPVRAIRDVLLHGLVGREDAGRSRDRATGPVAPARDDEREQHRDPASHTRNFGGGSRGLYVVCDTGYMSGPEARAPEPRET